MKTRPGWRLSNTFAAVVLAAGAPGVASAAETRLLCEGVAGGEPFSRMIAFDDVSVYSIGADGSLQTFCDAGSWTDDARLTATGPIDGATCMVDAQFVRVLTSPLPAAARPGDWGDWFVQLEIDRSSGEMRTFVGHPAEGRGLCRAPPSDQDERAEDVPALAAQWLASAV